MNKKAKELFDTYKGLLDQNQNVSPDERIEIEKWLKGYCEVLSADKDATEKLLDENEISNEMDEVIDLVRQATETLYKVMDINRRTGKLVIPYEATEILQKAQKILLPN